jgi:hypothetical protein
MEDWWGEIDREVLSALDGAGSMDPAEIGRRLGIPEKAASSLLWSLAAQGKVRIKAVELAAGA